MHKGNYACGTHRKKMMTPRFADTIISTSTDEKNQFHINDEFNFNDLLRNQMVGGVGLLEEGQKPSRIGAPSCDRTTPLGLKKQGWSGYPPRNLLIFPIHWENLPRRNQTQT